MIFDSITDVIDFLKVQEDNALFSEMGSAYQLPSD